jgi:hypothetical protein
MPRRRETPPKSASSARFDAIETFVDGADAAL